MKEKLWQMTRPLLPIILLSVLLGFLCDMSIVGLMAASAYLVTNAALHTPLYMLSLAITGVRTCGIFRAVFRYAERYISHNAAFLVWQRLRQVIYINVANALPFSKEVLNNGDVFTIVIESLDELRDAVLRLVLPPVGGMLLTVALFLFILPYSLGAAVVLAAAFLSIGLLLPYIFCPHREKQISLEGEICEYINGVRDMAAFNYGRVRRQITNDKIDFLIGQEEKSFHLEILAGTMAQVIAAAAVVSILAIFITILPYITAVKAAVLLLAVLAALEILVPLSGMGKQWNKAASAIERLDSLLQVRNTMLPIQQTKRIPDKNLLTVENISFGYDEKNLFDGLNFHLQVGEKVALVGGSGTGKSTLVNLLVRLLPYNDGTVYWHNDPYNDIPVEKIRENIKVALQEQYIFAASIRENFRILYPSITDEEIYKALTAAGLNDFVTNTPQKLATKTGRFGMFLSGGQRKRLIIAIALAGKSDMLILDEPTAGLDAITAQEIIDTIVNIGRQRTILVITHDLAAIERFDKVLVLSNGRIVQTGPPMQLATVKGPFAAMLAYRNAV